MSRKSRWHVDRCEFGVGRWQFEVVTRSERVERTARTNNQQPLTNSC